MGIYIKRKEITAVSVGGKLITSIYTGARLVWQAVRSCFGAGFWVNRKPWINGEGWRNE